MSRCSWRILAVGTLALVSLAGTARAQASGHNTLGDFGLQSGSQPEPGFYASGFYFRYDTDMVRNRDGEAVTFSPSDPGEMGLNAFAGLLWYVSDAKILGANYGAMAVISLANAALAVPFLGLEQGIGTALADIYLQPVNLGWHTPRADYTAGLGFFAPTGRYEVDADDNIGLGMWSFEFYGGATVYLDEARSWHLATTAFFETHTKKKDTDTRVGDLLSLEGGLGKSLLQGMANVGAAYYAQWKITSDDFGDDLALPAEFGKHHVFAAGPEVTFPIKTEAKLIALVNARYLWEFGARTKTEGNTLAITATFPVPSIPLN